MADSVDEWKIELIPDSDTLFYRINIDRLRFGLQPSCFFARPVSGSGRWSMSTDWSKYSTPEESLARAKEPNRNGIAELAVGGIRDTSIMDSSKHFLVEHSPDEILNNRSHSDVFWENCDGQDLDLRKALYRICQKKLVLTPAEMA